MFSADSPDDESVKGDGEYGDEYRYLIPFHSISPHEW
jgi:hypothetical protein